MRRGPHCGNTEDKWMCACIYMCVKEKASRFSDMWDCFVSFECVCMRVRVYLYLVKYACETKRVGVVPTDCFVSFHRVCVCVCVCVWERERVYFCMHVCICVWEEETGCSITWHCLVGFDCVFMCFCIWVYLHTFTQFDYCYIMHVWLCLLLYYCGFMSIGHNCYSVAFYLLMHPNYLRGRCIDAPPPLKSTWWYCLEAYYVQKKSYGSRESCS